MVDKILASNLANAKTHPVCGDSVSDNLHVFPAICEGCKKIGVIGDFMELPGAKLELVKAWAHGKRKPSRPEQDTGSADGNDEGIGKEDGPSETIKLPPDKGILLEGKSRTSTTCASTIPETSNTNRDTSLTANGPAPDLAQIKLRVTALKTRTERSLAKMRGQRPPTSG
ncbi:hypothetical protein AYL99_04724 [Fonsecaea erecta]|uniref:Uncharacterized protein n=1 Tax=Fonsecaea erecta TaxID=1367422 RepID=A0A178ZRR7_9EURO|nr:hypothetical protein AYL99_04724 [Fonsecaea erecta]OAP62519.1 hypothetical protein AYL99_04724 [Fonsecaea erecta]